MLSSLWPPAVLGGAELYAHELGERLAADGVTVGAVTLGVAGDGVVASVRPWPYRLDEFAGKPVWQRAAYHIGDVYRPDAAHVLRRSIERFRPDVVHSHAVEGLSSSVLAVPTRLGVPHVHTLHDYWLLCQRATMVRRDGESCERRCLSCVAFSSVRAAVARRGFPHVVIAPSEAIAREHTAFGAAADRIRVVLHPVEAPPIPRTPSTDRPTTFGYIGGLTEIKGVRTLVRAFGRMSPAGAALRVAGSGPLEHELRAAASGDVRFLGWLDQAARERFFGDIDCLVVPSEWREPAPLVINEAKARGVPVIGADIGGIPELVPASCRELLFPSGSETALTNALERFLARPHDFPVEPPSRGWDEHLVEIRAAYADAASALGGRGRSD